MVEPKRLLDDIQAIRAVNNRNWMDLARLALEVAPDRARAIFARISTMDEAILAISKQLAAPSENKR